MAEVTMRVSTSRYACFTLSDIQSFIEELMVRGAPMNQEIYVQMMGVDARIFADVGVS